MEPDWHNLETSIKGDSIASMELHLFSIRFNVHLSSSNYMTSPRDILLYIQQSFIRLFSLSQNKYFKNEDGSAGPGQHWIPTEARRKQTDLKEMQNWQYSYHNLTCLFCKPSLMKMKSLAFQYIGCFVHDLISKSNQLLLQNQLSTGISLVLFLIRLFSRSQRKYIHE